MEKAIKMGIIGAGANTRLHHIPKLQAIDGVEVDVVANRSESSSKKAAQDFGIPRTAKSWRDIVQDDSLDAVVIGTWPYMHKTCVVEALERGKHILCEARMAMNGADAREMYDVSLAHPELVAQVVPSPMTLGVDNTVRRLIDENYLGTIVSAELRGNSGNFVDFDRQMHWRENRNFSGNNILALGIWYEALMRWIGPALSVVAMGKTFVPFRPNGGDMGWATDIPDHLDVIAHMACGAQTHMQLSGVTGIGGTAEAFLFGTDGSLKFKGGELFGAHRGDTELAPISIPENEADGWRVEEEFVGAIRGTEEIKLTDFATGVRYMEFIDAVNESIKSGVAVGLPM